MSVSVGNQICIKTFACDVTGKTFEILNMDALPETIANIAFLSSGCAFSYIFFLPDFLFASTQFWPYVVMILFAIITAMVLLISKFNYNHVKFHHFYLLVIANTCFLAAAIQLLILGDYKGNQNVIYLMASGIGITHVASLSYIAVRTTKHERSTRVGLSYFGFFLGLSTSSTILELSEGSYGIVLTGFSAFLLLTLFFNEISQLRHLNDYKKCRDMDMNDLNNSSNIFVQKAVKQESPLDLLNTNIFAETGWKSTKNLMNDCNPPIGNRYNYGVVWLIYMISTNLTGFAVFYQMFLNTALVSVDFVTVNFLLVWVLVAGSLVGAGILFYVPSKHIYLAAASSCLIVFIPLLILFWLDFQNLVGIMFLVVYFLLGLISSIPDISIIELASLKNTEVSLSAGFTLKMLAIGVVQYINYVQSTIEDKNYFTYHAIVVILIILVSSILVSLHLPITFRKSLLEIQDYLDKNHKYTVCQEATKSATLPERAFDVPSYGQFDHTTIYATPQKHLNQPINQVLTSDNRVSQYSVVNVKPSTSEMPVNTSAIQHDLLTSMERYNYKESVNIFPRPRLSPMAINLAVNQV